MYCIRCTLESIRGLRTRDWKVAAAAMVVVVAPLRRTTLNCRPHCTGPCIWLQCRIPACRCIGRSCCTIRGKRARTSCTCRAVLAAAAAAMARARAMVAVVGVLAEMVAAGAAATHQQTHPRAVESRRPAPLCRWRESLVWAPRSPSRIFSYLGPSPSVTTPTATTRRCIWLLQSRSLGHSPWPCRCICQGSFRTRRSWDSSFGQTL